MTARTGTAAPDPARPAGTQETPAGTQGTPAGTQGTPAGTQGTPGTPAGTQGTPAELAGRLRLAMVELIRRTRNQDWASGLTPSRLSALAIIGDGGPIRIGELAARMAVTTPTVSHIVDALDEQDLIAREDDPHDRRACLVGISTTGRELLAELRTRTTGLLADQIGRLPEEQQVALAHALPVLEALGRADNLH